MISIEQVRLLGARVERFIEHVDKVTEENAALKTKLDACQKRIDELEVLIQRFKEDQAKIEDGILSALDRLNKFEDEMDRGISRAKPVTPAAGLAPGAAAVQTAQEKAPALKEEIPPDGVSEPVLSAEDEEEEAGEPDKDELEIF